MGRACGPCSQTTPKGFGLKLFIHQQMERQAARCPESVALVFEDESLSYAELNRRANRLAHHLVGLGVRPDSRVALWMERSVELVVGILGVLKAGAAYVALDPAYPAERLACMLDDCAPAVVLIQQRLRGGLPASAARVIAVDAKDDAATVSLRPDTDLDPAALGLAFEHLACVIYTSGSTGSPKGVMLHHAGLCNQVSIQAGLFDIEPESRILQFSSPSFDASLLDISMALCHGARLCVAPREAMLPGDPLVATLLRHAITHVTVPPSALAALGPGVRFPTVKTLVVAGEVCPPAVTRQWAPRHRLINIYGPTETTIFVTAELCQSEYAGSTPIGRPIGGVPIHILDADLQPVAAGDRGELYVGGVCVARGYHNKPELTAQRFIRDPFSAEPGARLYKTGDIGRWLPDGKIEYIGRSDFQVKLRGFRIELGEIETRLAACPGVREAVVVCREDVPGDKRLVAYLTATGDGEPLVINTVREQVKRFLPDHMLPSAWVRLDRFPLTPNGKTNRAALPLPQADAFPSAPFEAPVGDVEAALADIWAEVLRLPAIGREDNFFALGGHSLLATQMASRVRARMNVEMPLRTVFERPRLDALAAWLAVAPRDVDDAGAARQPPQRQAARRRGPLPCSFSQRRMWLVQQLNPQTTAYNMSFTLRLRGTLNADLLERSLDQVARHHEAFRTRFASIDGEPVQLLDAHPAVPLVRVDLRGLAPSEREAEARRELRAATMHRFDLGVAGLHTTTLLQLGDSDQVLLWLIHHAIGDQWSAGVLMQELQQVYSALVKGQSVELPAHAVQFTDYAEWQRDDAQQGALNSQLEFWRGQLGGLQALALPTDKPRRGPISGSGGSVVLDLGASRIDALKAFSTRHGATPFMTLLACFVVMLSRYSGQSDIAVGVPVANRHRIESESLVGTLVNTVVMRTQAHGQLGFDALLASVKETALQAYAHQDVPFNLLVQELAGQRDRNFSPLVQVMFNLVNAPFGVDGFADLKSEPFWFDHGAAQFDMSLTADTEVFGQVHLEYAADLFEPASARRMLANYVGVLDQVLEDPGLTVLGCALVSDAEQAELQAWNATAAPFETGLRLGDLVRRQAMQRGGATAVVFEGRRVSYADLDAAARALALRLRALGVGPGSLVGVCLERGVELVTALLGIVYSGGAYVPLDPYYPPERLARMCEDAELSVVVSRAAELLQVRAALPDGARIVHIDEPATAAAEPGGFELIGSPDDPAYVIFTSGSTGRPKGAMNAHKGIVNRLQWMQRQYQLTHDDRVLQKTPCSFDVAVWEFFWPLTTGACIVVARPQGHRDPAYLVDLIHQERITVLHFVPSMLRLFHDEPGLARCASVRHVMCSGEALPLELVEQFFERFGHAKLSNLYGPTEAAVDVTCWECQPGEPLGIVPIGRPIANTQIHVLDSQLRAQPVGVPGELYIGGVQVGMGYVSRPDLSAERFVPDPFNPGARMYKTGDLARWLSSGVIDCLGRIDDQVKLHGHRIELGEIESHLVAHPGVARCVVVVREDTPGDQRLVAYVVPRGEMPAVAALREHLRRQVPDHMVPQHCVGLASIPLLPNGKFDRAALPRPTDSAVVHDSAFWVPRTDIEVALAQVWQGLLGIEQVSTSDNFFDLGGHSLLAMRAVSDIHKRLGVRVSVQRLVFESLGQIAASLVGDLSDPAQHPSAAKTSTTHYLMHGLKRLLVRKGSPDFS